MAASPEEQTSSHGLAEAVMHAQALIRAAGTADGLRRAAASIAAAAAATGCSALVPASPSARGAVSAAVLLSGGSLTEVAEGEVLAGRVDKVLVVEVAAISGLHIRRRVESLCEAGAAWIGLVVLHDLADGLAAESGAHRFGPVNYLAAVA